MNRKLKILRITSQLFIDLLSTFKQDFKGYFEVLENGLPKDTMIIRSDYEINTGYLCLLITSEEFEEVRMGDVIPYIDSPVFGRVVTIECECGKSIVPERPFIKRKEVEDV